MSTYRRHFDEDIDRAESLLALANGNSPVVLKGQRRNDLRFSSVAMAVGAMDAYFCDAYVDCLARRLQSHKSGIQDLPAVYARRNLPIETILSPPQSMRPNWSLRMAARSVMERENVLDVDKVKELFNPVLPKGQELWHAAAEDLVRYNWKRLTGMTKSEYESRKVAKLKSTQNEVVGALKRRMADTIQLRHDWIHNCGRPKVAIQSLTDQQARARVREVQALVEVVDRHLESHRIV